MRTVTLSFPSTAAAYRAMLRASMYGVAYDADDLADGYLDVMVTADRAGATRFARIRPGAEIVSVLDEPLNGGKADTSALSRWATNAVSKLTDAQRDILANLKERSNA